MALVLPFPPPTIEWEIDGLYPAPSPIPVRGRGATAPTNAFAWVRGTPVYNTTMATLSGTPYMEATTGGEVVVIGGQSNGLDQDQFIQIFPAHPRIAQLPLGVPRPAEMRLWWWRFLVRFVNPTPTFGVLSGFGLHPYATGTAYQWLAEGGTTGGAGIGFYGNGSGGLAWTRKALNVNGPLAERTTVAWPRPLTQWTEVGFVIYSAGPGIPAQCVPVLDGIPQASLARAWGADGTGTGNPELGPQTLNQAMGFALLLMCAGATQPGMRMHVREVRFRAGRFDVSGVELTR